MDYFCRSRCKSWVWCVFFFELSREWPFGWIYWMIVSFPDAVHNFKIY